MLMMRSIFSTNWASRLVAVVGAAACLESQNRAASVDNAAYNPPKNIGFILFREMDLLDVFAPLDALQYLSHGYQLNLYQIAESLDPVKTLPRVATDNPKNSNFWPDFLPTYTFDDTPDDMEVLIVPGGPGVGYANVTDITDFIAARYPKLRYLISICTGAGLLAKSGVLDGRQATTNKRAWGEITKMGPKVDWIGKARWVVDGNIWTASGVTSGLDLIFAFIANVYSPDYMALIARTMEHVVQKDPAVDPFAVNNVSSTTTETGMTALY